ncbi:tRNA threonylcarbamoyladenosine dehydratase [Georgfuchsia toluolica]|uniref:tRNA threonylcarbamoyladenosine dehydratase n=1 Tax=Georgfuchsia toluolica TaxID=424218 RepID=A0A916J699_9PROT|nr:tRNA threonylcarbamoyladenosine dehydratase [Georgfuchsia toluolica]CAG4884746.1 tRNA threonylcarbamoyladenosine dehydratase [Georgfuchsia toluolica]
MDSQPDLERRFGGIARLYGAEGARRIAVAHVCVIGIGGVGSWAAETLARSGVGRITLIDLDHIAESNINRQIQADDATLGQAKVLAMQERIARINPQCIVACVEEFIDPENVATLLPACAAVIDAIDQVRAKAALAAHCRRHRIPLIMTGGAGGRIDPTRVCIDDLARTTQDALASKVRARLRGEYGFPRDPKKKFGIECVYSLEPIRRPVNESCDIDGGGAQHGTSGQISGLNCAGYGSSAAVTATFGMAAAARVLTLLTKA